MSRRVLTGAVAGLAIALLLVSCGEDDPVRPPVPFEVDARIVLGDGAAYTADSSVALDLVAAGADSVLLWNGAADSLVAGPWSELIEGGLHLDAWPLPAGEGLRTVNAIFAGGGLLSPVFSDSIIVDWTSPSVLPAALFPAAGAGPLPTAVTVVWSAAEDDGCPADTLAYTVYLGTDNPPTQAAWSGRGCCGELPGLAPSSAYYWQVEVCDGAGNAALGPVSSFTTWAVELPAFVAVPSGTYQMGSPASEPGHYIDETQHEVTITRPYFVATTEVTFGQFLPVLQWAYENGYVVVEGEGVYDDLGSGRELLLDLGDLGQIVFENGVFRPALEGWAVDVFGGTNWYTAAAYCDWLNILTGWHPVYDRWSDWSASGGDYCGRTAFRLPTEAEWEYACRAGTTTAFANGPITVVDGVDPVLEEIGWYDQNCRQWNRSPALKIANPWGIYDMHGGREEWCFDWSSDYEGERADDPIGPATGTRRMIRGGSCNFGPAFCRSTFRYSLLPGNMPAFGNSIRLVLSYGEQHD